MDSPIKYPMLCAHTVKLIAQNTEIYVQLDSSYLVRYQLASIIWRACEHGQKTLYTKRHYGIFFWNKVLVSENNILNNFKLIFQNGDNSG